MLDLNANYIDSRDIIEALAAWEEMLEEEGTLDEADMERLELLRHIDEEGGDNIPDWEYGETLIRDSAFIEYAQELAEDIGAVDPTAPWPLYCIDWERAARGLKADYTVIDIDGVAYWGRM